MEDVIGINDEGINSLVLEIGNERDSISNILNSYEDSMSHITECLKCPAGNTIGRKFQDIQKNFSLITNNLDVYSEDLIRVKSNHLNANKNAKSVMNQAVVHVDDFTKRNINMEVK